MELLSVEKLSILVGLSFFLGLSFEGFYWNSACSRPGGIRTFPLISLCGAILYALEPKYAVAFCVGLIVLGVWLYPYYRAEVAREGPTDGNADGIMVPLCNVVAYLLGPVALLQPPWFAIGLTVAAVLLLRARDQLHSLAQKIPGQEIITLAQFLVLAGVVLPLLPNQPVTKLTAITPFQVWLAVVVVSSLSYGSYLLHKLLPA
ncbi:MAG: MgtC/SapB family protein, partial [Planctomycetales bacterium]|nr:MgtC/SapB family protein [Planctomycetales bacterium]